EFLKTCVIVASFIKLYSFEFSIFLVNTQNKNLQIKKFIVIIVILSNKKDVDVKRAFRNQKRNGACYP
ncbi:hypothetical protein ACXIRI_001519, partial [Campylobacter coli]